MDYQVLTVTTKANNSYTFYFKAGQHPDITIVRGVISDYLTRIGDPGIAQNGYGRPYSKKISESTKLEEIDHSGIYVIDYD